MSLDEAVVRVTSDMDGAAVGGVTVDVDRVAVGERVTLDVDGVAVGGQW